MKKYLLFFLLLFIRPSLSSSSTFIPLHCSSHQHIEFVPFKNNDRYHRINKTRKDYNLKLKSNFINDDNSDRSYHGLQSSSLNSKFRDDTDTNNTYTYTNAYTYPYCTKSNLFVSPDQKMHREMKRIQKSMIKKRTRTRKMTTKKQTHTSNSNGNNNINTLLQQRRRPLGRFITSIIKCIIVQTTYFIMKVLNRTYLHDRNNNLQRYIFNRNATDVGLLTISNHNSILDDPGLWCGTLPLKQLTLDNMRNIIIVEELYYKSGNLSASILHGLNCLPIKRGDIRGLESPQLEELYKRLNGLHDDDNDDNDDNSSTSMNHNNNRKREWCHIMVEGRILQPWRFKLPTGNSLPQLGKFRLGAAKLIATSSPSKTIVLPIYHYGMSSIYPETPPKNPYEYHTTTNNDNDNDNDNGSNNNDNNNNNVMTATRISGKTKIRFPRIGKRVDVYVGEPIDFTDLVPDIVDDNDDNNKNNDNNDNNKGYTRAFNLPNDRQLLLEINTRLYNAMLQLEAKASQERVSI